MKYLAVSFLSLLLFLGMFNSIFINNNVWASEAEIEANRTTIKIKTDQQTDLCLVFDTEKILPPQETQCLANETLAIDLRHSGWNLGNLAYQAPNTAMIFMHLYKAYQKHFIFSLAPVKQVTTCCGRIINKPASSGDYFFFLAYSAEAIAHYLGSPFNTVAEDLEYLHSRWTRGAMVILSWLAWMYDCDCPHPYINKHFVMFIYSIWHLVNPFE